MSRSTQLSHGSAKMGENNRFSFAKTSFGKLHSELSGFLVREIASLDYSLSVFVGLFVKGIHGTSRNPF